MDFINCDEDASRAGAYATLEFANTYYLAYRDLPSIISEHVEGTKALDFGCGTGRSSRLLRMLGFDVIGVDISEDMLRAARDLDPSGDYRLIPGGNLSEFAAGSFDLVLSAFTFDNIPAAKKTRIFGDLQKLLKPREESSSAWFRRLRFTCTSGPLSVPRIFRRIPSLATVMWRASSYRPPGQKASRGHPLY